MLRTIGAVVLGYVAMFFFIFTTFSLLYLALGAERTYQPGTYDATALWMAASLPLSLAAAIGGGWVCARVAHNPSAAKYLAGLVLVLGVVSAYFELSSAPPPKEARTSNVTNMEAMMKSRQPTWVAVVNPIIGVVGVMLGARLVREKKREGVLV